MAIITFVADGQPSSGHLTSNTIYTIINIVNETEAYRLDALVELGRAWPQSLTAAEIARRRSIPPKFLARLLGELAREQLVVTARGARGGVRLATAPGDVPLVRLLRAQPQPEAGGPAVRWLAEHAAEAQAHALAGLSLAALLSVEDEANATADFAI
ncbi:MAG: hypothetical protein B7Z61_13460 [Acidobacteria bacterium 37-71-11]|nr:MAG: hypothetical protein B7Z61_13460 [Acidobacteria bacterium 37-71-11]